MKYDPGHECAYFRQIGTDIVNEYEDESGAITDRTVKSVWECVECAKPFLKTESLGFDDKMKMLELEF